MNNIKCECGHVNPLGTVLCEACGRVLQEEDDNKKLLDMRYEGSARRSQTYKKTLVDKIWNFFSSVKVGVILIVLTLIASIIGTIFPQEINLSGAVDIEKYYSDQYGWIGKVYYFLGFHRLYQSWWYILLVASIGVSLVICSLDRAIPLYRALKNQRVKRHESFLRRQRIYNRQEGRLDEEQFHKITERLKKNGYKIRVEDGDLFAEKGRFSRWGPYINHIGLIIFLFGLMFRNVPGIYVNESLWITEGDTRVIPGTNKEYYLENHRFIVEFYDESDREVYKKALEERGAIIKNFQANVTLYQAKEKTLPGEKPELEKIKDAEIRINEPLKFDQYSLYLAKYELNRMQMMEFTLTNKETGEEYGTIQINLENPEKVYDLGNGYSVEILEYFPDFDFVDGEPITKSPNPNNPAFAFKITTPDKLDGEISFVAIQQTIEPFGENTYKMKFQTMDTVNSTGIVVRKDLTIPIIALGGAIFLIGVAMGSFWQHRRIWIKHEQGDLLLAGHTNKNWYGFMKELEKITENTVLPKPIDQLETEELTESRGE